MTNKERPLITKSFKIEPIIQEDLGNYIYKYVEKYISESIDNWDNFCIDSLYKEYQKYGFTRAFVINREEFKQFLLWALPEYYKRYKNGK